MIFSFLGLRRYAFALIVLIWHVMCKTYKINNINN